MKSISWIMPLVIGSVLVVSGCSQLTKKSTSPVNRLTTSNTDGSGQSKVNALRLSRRSTPSSGKTSSGSLSSDFGQSSLSSREYLDGDRIANKITGLNDPNSVLSRRVLYFAYDQSTIKPEYFKVLDAHSEILASNPNLIIKIEGHADERGSREYNVALSERRAQAVKQFMNLKGVNSEQSQTIAYGEELPVNSAHNETAWSKNRRVEIKYVGQ